MQLQVYWRDLSGDVVFSKCGYTGSWGPVTPVEGIPNGYKFAALQWEDGKQLRLYYQEVRGSLIEYSSDNGGATWGKGEVLLRGRYKFHLGRRKFASKQFLVLFLLLCSFLALLSYLSYLYCFFNLSTLSTCSSLFKMYPFPR